MNPLKAPLNESEIRQAVGVVKRDAGLDDSAWFETISLDESGRFPGQRSVYVCCYEPASNRTLAGLILLETDTLHEWHHVEGAQARIVPDEFAMACKLARQDQRSETSGRAPRPPGAVARIVPTGPPRRPLGRSELPFRRAVPERRAPPRQQGEAPGSVNSCGVCHRSQPDTGVGVRSRRCKPGRAALPPTPRDNGKGSLPVRSLRRP